MENDDAYAGSGKKYRSDERKRGGKGSGGGGFCIQRRGYDKGRDKENRRSLCEDGDACSFQ